MSRKKRRHRERKKKARQLRGEKPVKGHHIDMGTLFVTGIVPEKREED